MLFFFCFFFFFLLILLDTQKELLALISSVCMVSVFYIKNLVNDGKVLL